MYAIIHDGGRQHRVVEGETIVIDRLDLKPGDEVEFPVVADRKVVSVQYRRRKNSRRKVGHRQKYTEVLIKSIVGPK